MPPYIVFCAANANVAARGSHASALITNAMFRPRQESQDGRDVKTALAQRVLPIVRVALLAAASLRCRSQELAIGLSPRPTLGPLADHGSFGQHQREAST
ncbi:MAG: hypothetical protein J2P50_19610 [Hyphomicrobiaceae bacterium]|nr:hypothetical protein [Hyphomicrobiaceae bacterium]